MKLFVSILVAILTVLVPFWAVGNSTNSFDNTIQTEPSLPIWKCPADAAERSEPKYRHCSAHQDDGSRESSIFPFALF